MTDRESAPETRPTVVLPSRRAAERGERVEPASVLDSLDALEVWHWDGTGDDEVGTARLAPAAEDVREAFDLDASGVAASDLDGVSLAAIQALAARVERQQATLERQADRIEAQQETLDAQRADLESLRSTVESIVSGVVALRRSLVDERST